MSVVLGLTSADLGGGCGLFKSEPVKTDDAADSSFLVRTIHEPFGLAIVSVALTPDDRYIMSQSFPPMISYRPARTLDDADKFIKVWRLADGALVSSIRTMSLPSGITVSPDSRFVVAGDVYRDGGTYIPYVSVWRVEDGARVDSLPLYSRGHLLVTPDGRQLITVTAPPRGDREDIVSWGFSEGAILWRLEAITDGDPNDPERISNILLTRDGGLLIASLGKSKSGSSRTIVWNASDRSVHKTLQMPPESGVVGVLPDGRHIVSVASQYYAGTRTWKPTRLVVVHRIADGAITSSFEVPREHMPQTAVTPDGKYLVSGGSAGALCIWRLADGTRVRKLAAHTDHVNGIEMTGDGQYIVSCGDDATIRVSRLVLP